jgi:hypothetical protein
MEEIRPGSGDSCNDTTTRILAQLTPNSTPITQISPDPQGSFSILLIW